jgi:hypothetical protein
LAYSFLPFGPVREVRVTVVASGDGELAAWVGEAVRPLFLRSLDDHLSVGENALAYARTEDRREQLEVRLDIIGRLRRQIEDTVGPTQVVGPAQLVAEFVRSAASQAAHELDVKIEALGASRAALSDSELDELRAATLATTSCVEALIACESSRER